MSSTAPGAPFAPSVPTSPYHLMDVSIGRIICEPPCPECVEHFYDEAGNEREPVYPADAADLAPTYRTVQIVGFAPFVRTQPGLPALSVAQPSNVVRFRPRAPKPTMADLGGDAA